MFSIKTDILNSKILIVEDDYLGLVVLQEIFKKQGFTKIEEAENGRNALEKIQLYKPDIVIMDVIMPEMDGIECCKRIRANPDPEIANVPILVQTALSKSSDKADLFEAGATDYITKPIDSHELVARCVVHLERELLSRRLRDFNARITAELETAHKSQQVLVPSKKLIVATEKNHNVQICERYQPSSELGGDFWGFKSLSENELAVYMGDFSGHGVNAALNVFRLHALMQTAVDIAKNPAHYLTHINSILSPILPSGQFTTMFYGVINNQKNTLTYASAACPPPVVFRKQYGDYQLLANGETLLGAVNGTIYQQTEVEFLAGDMLLIYSDALIETPDENGEMLAIESWADMLQQLIKQENNGCGKAFDEVLEYFCKKYLPNINDDLTVNAYFRKL